MDTEPGFYDARDRLIRVGVLLRDIGYRMPEGHARYRLELQRNPFTQAPAHSLEQALRIGLGSLMQA